MGGQDSPVPHTWPTSKNTSIPPSISRSQMCTDPLHSTFPDPHTWTRGNLRITTTSSPRINSDPRTTPVGRQTPDVPPRISNRLTGPLLTTGVFPLISRLTTTRVGPLPTGKTGDPCNRGILPTGINVRGSSPGIPGADLRGTETHHHHPVEGNGDLVAVAVEAIVEGR